MKLGVEKHLERGETFLKLKDWDMAIEAFADASEIEPSNYQTWLGLVRAVTENFTDLDDTRHIEYYRRALAVANDDERRTVNDLCRQFVFRSETHQVQQLELKKQQLDNEFIKGQKKIIRRTLMCSLIPE